MKKKILFLVPILAVLLSVSNVNAEMISPSFTYINYQHNPMANLYQGLSQLPTLYHANPNFNVLFTIYIPTEKEHFNQVRVGFCTTNPEKITNFDVVNDNTGEGALANRNIKFISTNIKCSNLSDTYNFQYVYAYFDVLDWKDTTIGGGTIGYSYLESYINVYTSGNNYIYLNDIVIADSDLYTVDYTAYRDYNVITNQKIDITNDKLDDMLNADAEPSVTPDDEKYDDYESAEGSLKDKVNQADLSNLSIGIDANSSKWIWETLTSLLQSHSAIFGMVIAILSIGIIKLALGR